MAQGKNKVILYPDIISSVEKLTDEEAGKLFKHYLRYVNDLDPAPPDRLTELLFEPMKAQLKRDYKAWLKTCERNQKNGGKGGRPPSNPQEPKKPTRLFHNPKNPNEPDNDNDNDNDIDNDNTINKLIVRKDKFFKKVIDEFSVKYEHDMLVKFLNYWTEHNDKGIKMRFELAKNQPFSVARRLVTWNERNKNPGVFGQNKKVSASQLLSEKVLPKNG